MQRVSNREFNTVTGTYKDAACRCSRRGIGIGNIDISVTELDALVNVDFATRRVKSEKKRLTLVRLGTSGALQPDIAVGEFVYARTSVGFDGLLNYYAGRNEVCDLALERAFTAHTGWNELLPKPYFVDADPTLTGALPRHHARGHHHRRPGLLRPAGPLGAHRAAGSGTQPQDRVVRIRRPPHHQLRDGEFGPLAGSSRP